MITTIAAITAAVLIGAALLYYFYQQKGSPQITITPIKYEATLEQAIDNAAQMIAYAARSGKSLNDVDIKAVLEARRAGNHLDGDKEAAFWTSAAKISQAVAPVTIDSLNSSSSKSLQEKSPAESAGRRYRIRTFVTLGALLIFQIYWLIGATVTSDLKEIRTRLEKLEVEGPAGKAALAKLDESDSEYKSQKAKLDAEADSWNDRLWVERISAWADFEVLRSWNVAKRLIIGNDHDSAPPSKVPDERRPEDSEIKSSDFFLWVFNPPNAEELQTAQIILTSLLKYILPILYGALGASAYIVRSLATELKDYTYSVASIARYELRFYLGAVAGLSIAWFTSDPKGAEAAGILQSLSPLALAFLAGYSVELLFSLLDRLVSAFSGPKPKRVP